MSAALTLLASGLGASGGAFALQADGFRALDAASTTGLAVSDDGRLLARVLWNEDEKGAGELLLYDEDGVVVYRRLDALREPHAALWHGEELVLVSTLENALLWVNRSGEVVREWRAPGIGDCWHLNGLVVHDGRLLVSAFGRFTRHREWAEPGAREGRGILFDPWTGADVLAGLSCPHDPTPVDGGWLVCNSAAGAITRLDGDGTPLATRSLGGWPRGLAVDGDRVYLGISAHRLAGVGGTAAVAALDRRTLEERERWELPCAEVFTLAWVPEPLLRGVRAGFAGTSVCLPSGLADDGPAPLAEADCSVRLVASEPPPELPAATAFWLRYRIRNAGAATLASAGPTPVHVGVRWVRADSGELVDEHRDRLRVAVRPGAEVAGHVELWTPAAPGSYVLRVSAVQEHVRWFDDLDPANGWTARVAVTARERARTL